MKAPERGSLIEETTKFDKVDIPLNAVQWLTKKSSFLFRITVTLPRF